VSSVGVEVSGMKLSDLIAATNGELLGDDALFCSVSTDTRHLSQGDLFVAIKGPHFDAHDFIDKVSEKNAVAIIVNHPVETDLPQLVVADTRIALGQIAALWRDRFDIPVIAVTGSNGKTTVKEMLASILSQRHCVLVTQGNFNNDIGVPLTLLRLKAEHDVAVIEMGASQQGDIEYLSKMVRPNVALLTNAAAAHLEGFGDIAGVARAKGEIFCGLSEDGSAILNADDSRSGLWRVMAGERRCHYFGIRHKAEVTVTDLQDNGQSGSIFKLKTPQGQVLVKLPLAGRHNVMNALAASAAVDVISVSLDDICAGLQAMQAVSGRLAIQRGINNSCLINDSYNANPSSMRAALDVLVAGGGEKILVVGDMAELGNSARALHEQVGRQARTSGVDRVFAVGEYAALTAGTFGQGGRHFSNQKELIVELREHLLLPRSMMMEITVLVKGSRSMAMEQVVAALAGNENEMLGDSGESSSEKQPELRG